MRAAVDLDDQWVFLLFSLPVVPSAIVALAVVIGRVEHPALDLDALALEAYLFGFGQRLFVE
jgi:hypothetical protein